MRLLVCFQKLNIAFIRSLHEEGSLGTKRWRGTRDDVLSLLCRKIAFRATRIKVGIGTTDDTEGRLLDTTFGRFVGRSTLSKDGKTPVTHDCV
jgi:hypothetical protein